MGIKSIALAVSTLVLSVNANAALIFTDINITSNSLSFTIDGDMTGYTAPTTTVRQQYFAVGYSDSLCSGCSSDFGANPNNISQSIFSNQNISSSGYTGKWGAEQNGSWSRYGSLIAGGITGGPRTINYSWTNNLFDTLATDGVMTFYWGTNFNSEGSYYTEIASFNYVGNGQFDSPNSVPVPAAVWLFGSGLIGLVGVARRKKS